MKFALDTTLLLFIHTKGCMFVFYKKEIYCCYLYNSIKVLESPGILSKLLEKSRNFDGKSPGKSGKKSWKVLEFKLIFFFFFFCMKRLGEFVKQIKFEEVWGKSEARNCFQILPFTKYLRQTPVFIGNSAPREKVNFCFSRYF